MQNKQSRTSLDDLALKTERLGPLPLINHFLERMGLEELLEQYVPTPDQRCAVAHSRALGVLLRSIVVEREPIYRQAETIHGFASGLFGLSARQIGRMDDDRLGRALDQLFQADRAALLTAVVVAVARRFQVRFDRLHNDSTSVAFCGQYRRQHTNRFGQRAAAITYGYSKDHRPDLKQLLFILTTEGDGGIPVQFRAAAGNTNDSVTHIETWNALRAVAARSDFLYVADSKLCSFDNLDYIHRAGGRFVTVMPRSRREDGHFRKWIQTHSPEWELLWDRPHPRQRSTGPRDRWSVYRDPLPSREGWSVIWVWSSLLTLHQQERRHRHLAASTEALSSLRARLLSSRSRLRGGARIDLAIEKILERYQVRRYLKVKRTMRHEHTFKQARRGRPGPNTAYRRITPPLRC